MRILGVDPGLDTTGYGCVEAAPGTTPALLEGGVIRSDAKAPLERRLRDLYEGLAEVCRDLCPDAVVVEELYAHYAHPRTAILMGHARGVLYLAAGRQDLPVASYAATRIKKSLTGSGRASKAQVQASIASALGLAGPPEPADVADALAAALCHASTLASAAGALRTAS